MCRKKKSELTHGVNHSMTWNFCLDTGWLNERSELHNCISYGEKQLPSCYRAEQTCLGPTATPLPMLIGCGMTHNGTQENDIHIRLFCLLWFSWWKRLDLDLRLLGRALKRVLWTPPAREKEPCLPAAFAVLKENWAEFKVLFFPLLWF